ncbi:nucleotidyltransferase domain-containing protein [Methylobacterium sp. E-041]|uniref:nucleotidyltransferase domain-containing protein n=1 Tax=unclassified Methylobacterium TaxID=2615210 RepID=UPI001FB90DE8|nr:MULTISPECIES: nucleotidyltransferase domain-containing protein [unclassified Methylobacterium]MCJ2037377.1 nucleotidyltransferase domain-containing protein [Methylobacterium sp. J-059]MCJ2106527.1 nucleotidyltransferase domain-containing protein [Methylobacterium sp. E-041]
MSNNPNVPMTPQDYVRAIVLPTLTEFRTARDNRRRAYLACLVICHVADSLALAEVQAQPGFGGMSGNARKTAVRNALKRVQATVEAQCAQASIVLAIANGVKHPEKLPLLPGSERDVPQFALDTPGAGLDEGRFDAPGLAVEVDGQQHFLDVYAQQVLAAYVRAYPKHLGEILLSSFMDPGLEFLGLDIEPTWLTGLAAWAAGKSEIAELWLYGSRASGTARADSDVDIGLVLADVAPEYPGAIVHDWPLGNYTALGDRWGKELMAIVGRHVSLELFARSGEIESREACAAKVSAIMLWSRASG